LDSFTLLKRKTRPAFKTKLLQSDFKIAESSLPAILFHLIDRLKSVAFQCSLESWKQKEPAGAASDEYGARGTIVVEFLAKKLVTSMDLCAGALSWRIVAAQHPRIVSPQIRPFLSHCFRTTSLLDNILY